MDVNFSKTFSDRQKVAVLSLLMHVCKIDGNVDSREEYLFADYLEMLNLEMTDEVQRLTDEIGNSYFSDLMNIVNTLNKSQKEWVVTCLYSIVRVDGKIHEKEEDAMNDIFEKMGFSYEEIVTILNKQIAIENRINQNSYQRRREYVKSNNSGCFGAIALLIISISSVIIYNIL